MCSCWFLYFFPDLLFKASFAMAGAVAQPVKAAIGVCQFLKDKVKQAVRGEEVPDLPELLKALCFAVDAIKNSIHQTSCLALPLVHVRRVLRLKHWSAELTCKKLLTGFPFHGERLFGEDLDKYIQKISGGKSTLLPVKRRPTAGHLKRTYRYVLVPSRAILPTYICRRRSLSG